MVDVIRQSTTLCVMHQPAHSLPRHVWTDRQQWPTTLSFAHPSEQRLKDNPLFLVLQPYPAITVSKQPIELLHPITGSTRSNRRFLSGTTKLAILASNTGTASIHCRCNHPNPDPVQCNTLRDEWSRLKAAATQLERVDGRKQWVKHADNLEPRCIRRSNRSRIRCCTCHVWKQFP
ncbi:hypothetical protein BASA83_008348 [Batrachochytrium salamandrivorans]|nr:hypothetical protein BASA83_008348 [Batrachochytrium salamandrivorans]